MIYRFIYPNGTRGEWTKTTDIVGVKITAHALDLAYEMWCGSYTVKVTVNEI
jgi:hypothetical protein